MKRLRKRVIFWVLAFAFFLTAAADPACAEDGERKLSNALNQAREAGVPDSMTERLLALGFERQLNRDSIANLLTLLAEAAGKDIPTEFLFKKIEEGISKKVKGPIIEQVVLTRLEDYRLTRSTIVDYLDGQGGRRTGPAPLEYIVRLNESLYYGLTRDDLNRLLAAVPKASLLDLIRGAELMACFRQIKFKDEFAEQIVFAGIRRSYFTECPRELSRAVAAAKKQGIPESRIVETAVYIIEKNKPLKEFIEMLQIPALALK